MFFSILQRSIFRELVKAFSLSLVALTCILLLAGIVAEASQRGLAPDQILMAIPLIIPSTLPYTIPSTTLFAACLVYGRLAHDNEITAIKAAGINLFFVVWPGVVLGLLTAAVTMSLYYHTIPTTQYLLRAQFVKDVEEFLYGMLRSDRCINHPRMNYAIWVRQLQGRRLIDATIKRRDGKGRYDLIAHAKEAEIKVDARNQKILMLMRQVEVYSVTNQTRACSEVQTWEEKLPDSLIETQHLKNREMTWPVLLENKQRLDNELADWDRQIEDAAAAAARSPKKPELTQHFNNLKQHRRWRMGEQINVANEIQMRPALAVGCICFVLVGCPVGIWFSKRDYLSAFITCFLPIVFVYYPLLLTGMSLTRNGKIPPTLAIWACNIVVGLAGLVLLRRLTRN